MNCSKIKFCNGYAANLSNNREKSDILKNLYINFNLENKNKTYIYSNKHLNTLYKNKHLVTYITQGNNYYLYLLKIKNEPYSILIDKKISTNHKFPKMIIINIRFHESLYTNTVFDGELFRHNDNTWEFIINDILIYNNNYCHNNFYKRLSFLYNILSTKYIYDPNIQLFDISIKKYVCLSNIEELIKKHILNYKIIGIHFTAINSNNKNIAFYFNLKNVHKNNDRITFLEDRNSFNKSHKKELLLLNNLKLNKLSKDTYDQNDILLIMLSNLNNYYKNIYTYNTHIVTFSVKKTKLYNIYILYCEKDSCLYNNSIARIDTIELAEYMNKLFKNDTHILMDCIYCPKFSKWIPIKKSFNRHVDTYTTINKFINNLRTC